MPEPDWKRYEAEQRQWDLEHLTDDEWARRYSPNGGGFVVALVLSAMLFGIVMGIVTLAIR